MLANRSRLPSQEPVVFLTDVVTPYMVTVFAALSEIVPLAVIFCAATGSRSMPWKVDQTPSFSHRIVGGLTIRRGPDRTDYHLSPRIFGAIARARPRAIIAAGYSAPTLYAAIYCAMRRIPLLIHSDGTSASERQLDPVQGLARKVLLRRASACVANSGPAADRFRELGVAPDRVFLAPHSTNLEPYWALAQDRDYSEPSLRILASGRLISRKGLDLLLRALAVVRQSIPDAQLFLVGSGPQERELRALRDELHLAPAVHFSGFVDQDELPALYGEADAFAFPTLDDPFGFVLLEAAAAGLPAVASPHGGATQDLVTDGVNGLVADPRNVAAFAAALVKLGDPGLRERLGRAAYEGTRQRTPAAAAGGYLRAVEAAEREPRSAVG